MDRGPTPPSGIRHIRLLATQAEKTRLQTAQHFEEPLLGLEMVGTALNALYQAATCHRKCHGGGHHLERLCGRAYNLGQAAWELTMSGLYDEALSLVRSLGEISNIIAMSAVDKQAIQDWMRADTRTRKSKFSAVKIRLILEQKGSQYMLATEDWYSDLSESYTHPNPAMLPGHHEGQSIVGGVYQEKGFVKALDELSTVLAHVAIMVCRFMDFSDLLAEFDKIIDKVEAQSDGNVTHVAGPA